MRLWLLLAGLLLVPPLISPAWALESATVSSERATASLVSDTDAFAPGQPFRLGLRLRLAQGWHTYWQNPGDAGTAPELSVTASPQASIGPIAWPTPQRLSEGPVMTYAYTGEILLPVRVTPPAAGAPLDIEAHASWLVCARICVPEEGTFRLQLPPGHPAPSAQAGLFAAADRLVPRPSPWPARISSDGTLSMTGEGLTPARVQAAWFFPASWGAIDQAAPQHLSVRNGGLTLALAPGQAFDPKAALSGVLVLRDPAGEESNLEITAVPGRLPVLPIAPPLLRLLGLAVLGGLLLNLMPCVFPVLAMKALSLAGLSGAARREVRRDALSYTAGVLVAFAGIAGLLLLLRRAGAAAGWGFQFQSPAFVAAMAWLLFGVGLNLSGVFEIGARLAGTGQHLASRRGYVGAFFTGLLAVLVATPCTAPFMGAAVAAALSATAPVALLLFLALGLGLAAPYLLLAAVPALAHALPKPGRWMELLRQGLAFPMYAAAAWLVWVIDRESGAAGVMGVTAGMVLLGFAAWALGAAQQAGMRGRRLGRVTALAASLAAAAMLPGIAAAPAAQQARADDGAEPFSPARLAALRAEGRPIFVNLTAAWCVTCLVNERVALSPAPVREAFAERHVVYLKGDWTRQDPQITAFLRQQGRDGVPLYLFYPAGGAAPTVLPQILTESEVLDRIEHAGS